MQESYTTTDIETLTNLVLRSQESEWSLDFEKLCTELSKKRSDLSQQVQEQINARLVRYDSLTQNLKTELDVVFGTKDYLSNRISTALNELATYPKLAYQIYCTINKFKPLTTGEEFNQELRTRYETTLPNEEDEGSTIDPSEVCVSVGGSEADDQISCVSTASRYQVIGSDPTHPLHDGILDHV